MSCVVPIMPRIWVSGGSCWALPIAAQAPTSVRARASAPIPRPIILFLIAVPPFFECLIPYPETGLPRAGLKTGVL